MAFRSEFPLPDTEWEPLAPFWAGAARRELVIPRCDNCGRWCWYPRDMCPKCNGTAFTWAPVSGRGRLFAWTVVRQPFLPQFKDEIPYVPALVAIDEDPAVRLVTRVVDTTPEELAVDLPLEVTYRPLRFPGIDREVPASFFRPAPAGD